MAIVLPVLGVLLFALWQFGSVYDTWQNLSSAVTSGARAAAAAPAGSQLAAGEVAAEQAGEGQITLESFTVDRITAQGATSVKATACTTYSIDLLGITFKRGQFCRQATMPVA